jgi:hypothetical protein
MSLFLPQNYAYSSPYTASYHPSQTGYIESTSSVNSSSGVDKAQEAQMLNKALEHLGQIQNRSEDVATLQKLGITPLFNTGQDALKVIRDKNIEVGFGDMGDSPAHAEWQSDKNRIIINQKYKNDSSPENLYAMSEAIYHEAGHASGNGDDRSSVQEEINCLALNALGYRYHAASDPAYAASASKSPLISNGVALYSKLFFEDPDSTRQALVRRVADKYGDLPLSSPGHPVRSDGANLANRVTELVRQREKANYFVSTLNQQNPPGAAA